MNLPEFLAEVRRRTKAIVATGQVCYGAVHFFIGVRRAKAGWLRTRLDNNGVLVVTIVVVFSDHRSGLLLRAVAVARKIPVELTSEAYQKAVNDLPY